MSLSVVIPTYNRADKLRQTLLGYLRQTASSAIREIIVVNDGSTDHTASVIDEFGGNNIEVCSRYQQNSGLSAARNHAIYRARGDIILFGDDDIIPSETLVAEHLSLHAKHPRPEVGVLGFVPWLPGVNPTPFMKWSGLYGPQFNFGHFEAEKPLGFQFGYFCNTSVHTHFLRTNGLFDEDLRTYGYEDLELSYRLMQRGYTLLYSPTAIGLHNKYETFNDTLKRVTKLYESWPTFSKTEAGAAFLTLWQQGRAQRQGSRRSLNVRPLKRLKSFVIPLLRPLLDTHLPLPRWVYEQIFYHYVPSFSSVAQIPHLPTCTELQKDVITGEISR